MHGSKIVNTPPAVSPNSDTYAEQVVLVHGTFASSAEDCGAGWWQVGSEAYEELKARLPSNVALMSEGNVFRWSGENTERARRKAAVKLLRHVEPLERAGVRYHLIGHSHGGSVIWTSLRLATARKKPLNHLQSWSTVGTPFLHHRSRSAWSPINVTYMVIAAVLLYPAFTAFKALADIPHKIASGEMKEGIIVRPAEEAGIVMATARVPLLKGLELLGVEFTPTDSGLRAGSFVTGSGQSVTHFLFGTVEGWLIVGAIVLFGYMMLVLAGFFLKPVSEGLRIGWEKRLEQRAFACYRGRWLGIWTQDDEAINGLRATMQLSVSFIGNLVVRERVFVSDLIGLPSRPLYRMFAPIYNRMIRPVLDSKIREIVIKTAQGNDRPAARVINVSPHPILPPPAALVPPLPDSLRESIRQQADDHANDLGPKLRQLLSQPSLTAGMERFSKDLSGSELVHTSYFDHPDVIELLALNIGWTRARTKPRPSSVSSETVRWFNEFKRLQGVDVTRSKFSPRLRRSKAKPRQITNHAA